MFWLVIVPRNEIKKGRYSPAALTDFEVSSPRFSVLHVFGVFAHLNMLGMASGIRCHLPVIVFVTSLGLKCFEQTLGHTFLETCMRLKDEL